MPGDCEEQGSRRLLSGMIAPPEASHQGILGISSNQDGIFGLLPQQTLSLCQMRGLKIGSVGVLPENGETCGGPSEYPHGSKRPPC